VPSLFNKTNSSSRLAHATVSPRVPIALRRAVVARGIMRDDVIWTPLSGGRTNQVWLIGSNSGAKQDNALICKLYGRPDNNPLYPNLAGAEYEALKALHRRDIAPKPVALLNLDMGEALIYQRLDGEIWSRDGKSVAEMLGKLHDLDLMIPLHHLPTGSHALEMQVRAIIADLREPLPNLPKDVPVKPADALARLSLIHTDIVATNIIVTASGLRLIDWQCPAFGDPCEDLASFLSPAMQRLYAQEQLSSSAREAFLDAYPDRKTVTRYRCLAPLFHWRIAAYCNWKVERGDEDYRAAMALELIALNELRGDHE